MNNFKLRIACLFFTIIYLFTGIVAPAFAQVSYTYDQNGNMTSDGTNCYTYNDANQLSKVTNCNSGQTIAQYLYDYQGNRIEKKVYTTGSLQQTVYTPNKDYQTVKLASNGATLNTSYYSVNDELAAQKNPDGSKYYYLSDNLGSTSILTNQSGSVVEATAYLPFGQIQSGGTQSNHLYTGQVNDSETNLDYYNARYYDPSLMHFTQPDSELPNVYDPQQLNRYSYVRNNPMTVTDPTGHYGIFDFALAVTAVAGGIVDLGLEIGGAIHGAVTSHDTSLPGRALSAAAGAQKAVQSPVGQFANGAAFFAYTLATGRTTNNDEEDSNFVPNPYGRLGGPAHQETVSQTFDDLMSKGYTDITTEKQVYTPGGGKSYRFGDVFGVSPQGDNEIFQIGRQTQAGNPVAREVTAQQDINNGYMIDLNGDKQNIDSTTFIPYNN